MSRVLSIVAAMAIVGSVAVVDGATTAHALPTSCSVRYSWAKQMTVIPAYANRHFQPGQGTCSSDSYLYFGWVGVFEFKNADGPALTADLIQLLHDRLDRRDLRRIARNDQAIG